MSIATATPRTDPSVNRSWIKANAIAGAIYVVMGLIILAADKLLGLSEPTTSMLFRGIGAAIGFAATVLMFVAYATLTAAALGEKLSGLSRHGWIALHTGIGVAFGAIFAAMTLFGPASSDAPAEVPSEMIILVGVLIFGLIFGPIVGAVFGGLQALVLRRAAAGAGAWILWSMLATAVMLLIVVYGVMMIAGPGMDPTKIGLGQQLLVQAVLFAATVLGAAIMLPAVKRLTPRG